MIPVKAISVGWGFTWITAESWLLPALASVRLCIATRVCPPSAAFVVFQLKERVERTPTASPLTVCVPRVRPAVVSRRVTTKLLATL